MTYSKREQLDIKITASVNIALYIISFVIAAIVFFRFIIPLGIRNSNILLFYLLTFLLMLFRTIEVGHMLFNPDAVQWEYKVNSAPTFFEIISSAATCTFLALGLLMISTMFQIGKSIQVLLGTIENKQAQIKVTNLNYFLIICTMAFTCFCIGAFIIF